MPLLPHYQAADLQALPVAAPSSPRPDCCAYVRAPGWESLPAAFDAAQFAPLASLRPPDVYAPEVLAEYHPGGTSFWSADAPVAPRYFPYNQSEVWRCVDCARPFLRYTEAGGYYVEERIRELDPALVVDAPLP
ncbi:hypothetical protein GN316_04910 [Xylophilus sp. Kf1]|nr:hypothetical protein [Xylophilus sp. Kf1]